MEKKIVTVGHIVYDIRNYVEKFPEPDHTAVMRMHPKVSGGGSAANVAVNLVKLGWKSGVIGNVGSDRHGKFLLSDLKRRGVDTSQVRVFNGMSGLSVIIIDEEGEVRIIEDYGVADRRRAIDPSYIAESRFLHMSGCAFHLLDSASKIASKRGIPISFDPGRAASRLGERKLAPILHRAEYLIINRKELFAMTGSREEAAAAWLAKKYDLICVIKQGAREIIVKTKSADSFTVEPFNVKPVDTLGAGDAFCAGFIAGVNENRSLYESVRFANAVAAAKVLRKGAQSLPSRRFICKRFKL
ncbi:MAG: carbohydrate kinase family protein [Candidatus Micrarchaeota archaeon]|nr:carbohydrate kinase family protein [Candidatus Micrarchaeota archaeon]